MTILKTRSSSTETIDIAQLSHWSKHPRLVPLIGRRAELRQRRHDLERDITAQRRALFALRQEDDFHARVSRREAQDKLENLERQGATLEADLHALQTEIESTADLVKIELAPVIAAEGAPLAEELLGALEHLADVSARYGAYAQRTYNLLGKFMASLPWPSPALDSCIKQTQQMHERLVHLSAP